MTVEVCQLNRCQYVDIPWRDVSVLPIRSPSAPVPLVGQREGEEYYVVCDAQEKLLQKEGRALVGVDQAVPPIFVRRNRCTPHNSVSSTFEYALGVKNITIWNIEQAVIRKICISIGT